MNTLKIKQMEKFEKTFWWHIGKKALVKDVMQRYFPQGASKILEIGSGAGEITKLLQDYGEVYANDISSEAINFCREKGIKNTLEGDINELDLTAFRESFDIVLALDVLEHIQEDTETMGKVMGLLKPGGKFFVNVPAYKFLWSAHDEALYHKRRYAAYEIRTKLREQNFEIVKQSYFVFFVFPGIAFFKVLSNFIGNDAYPQTSYILLPKRINNLFVKLLQLESKLLEHINLPFGTTITLVAKKPTD